MSDVFARLCERGYVAGYSEPLPELHNLLLGNTTIYQGFDPTASSLHVGHLESLMVFHHLQQAGHRLIFLVGGATALVGDPSGKDTGRPLLSPAEVAANADAIRRQVQSMGLVTFEPTGSGAPPVLMLNNADWLDLNLLSYLREITPHFSVNTMLRRETFARRLGEQHNLSLLEFLYPTLQAYDFLYLFDHYSCQLQMGGADQWGNIMDGIDLVRRVRRVNVHALVFPLLLDNRGQKMGKTSDGQTIWLDPQRTPPFSFYQYWVNTADNDVKRNLEIFTLLPLAEIQQIAAGDPRSAQHRLAFEVTKIVHGQGAALQAQNDSRAAFAGNGSVPQGVPTYALSLTDLEHGVPIATVLKRADVVPSLSAARRLITQNGVRVSSTVVEGEDSLLTLEHFTCSEQQDSVLIQYGKGKVLKVTIQS